LRGKVKSAVAEDLFEFPTGMRHQPGSFGVTGVLWVDRCRNHILVWSLAGQREELYSDDLVDRLAHAQVANLCTSCDKCDERV
jgi:hypothetical protein